MGFHSIGVYIQQGRLETVRDCMIAPSWIYSWWATMTPEDWQHVRWQLIMDDGGIARDVEQQALINIRNKAYIAIKLRAAYDTREYE